MSQNRPGNENDFSGSGSSTGSGGASGGTGSGGVSSGTGSGGGSGLSTTGGGAATGAATAPASGIGAKAKEYSQTVADAATTAKDYITDKASVVGDKIQGLRDVDYTEYANQAKDYARSNPGQALLVAAAAGFVIGLLVRGGRR
ncbi:MAG: C-terminal glycine zipper region [Acidobacteriota bacterium]|jgi:ElaB/YqjD/DUF883 family membrane-anchored ribosome-binding protein|nr:C-terminal glycine zipper region [Acidobacteriota bacterium]